MKVWPYEVSYIHAILQLYIQFCLDLQISIFFLLSSDNSFWFTFKDVVILVSLLLHWHVKILIPGLGSCASAANKPHIQTCFDTLNIFKKRDNRIQVRLRLLKFFPSLFSLFLSYSFFAIDYSPLSLFLIFYFCFFPFFPVSSRFHICKLSLFFFTFFLIFQN